MSDPDPGEGGIIIIKGGSCEIHFDDGVFKHDPTGQPKRKHKHDTLKIQRIVIKGNQEFDSNDIPGGFKGEIRITCKP
ncbi:MAG TPA: hypothetical protein VGJ48_22755 [Pyrinomonadaceae bacterium]|jgi:hypothetical protein